MVMDGPLHAFQVAGSPSDSQLLALFELGRVDLPEKARWIITSKNLTANQGRSNSASASGEDCKEGPGDMAATGPAVADYKPDAASLSAVLAPLRPLSGFALKPVDDLHIDPAECALAVMDYQPAILCSTPDAEAMITCVNAAADNIRRRGGHVAFVRTAFEAPDYRFIPSTNRALYGIAADKYLRDGTPGAALHERLAYCPGDMLIRKVRVGAFSATNFDERLTNLGVTTLILAGVHTSGVVLSTVRAAADRDYRVIVLSDCTSDADSDVHDILMKRILPSQADIATAAEVNSWLSDS